MATNKKTKHKGGLTNQQRAYAQFYKQVNDRHYYYHGENSGFTRATVCVLYVLHDKFGWGTVRLVRVLDFIVDFCKSYVAGGYVSVEDMAQVLADECDIKIDIQTGLIDVEKLVERGIVQ